MQSRQSRSAPRCACSRRRSPTPRVARLANTGSLGSSAASPAFVLARAFVADGESRGSLCPEGTVRWLARRWLLCWPSRRPQSRTTRFSVSSRAVVTMTPGQAPASTKNGSRERPIWKAQRVIMTLASVTVLGECVDSTQAPRPADRRRVLPGSVWVENRPADAVWAGVDVGRRWPSTRITGSACVLSRIIGEPDPVAEHRWTLPRNGSGASHR